MNKDKYVFAQLTSFLDRNKFNFIVRKHKGGIKMHTLFDAETQIPAFIHVSKASAHDSTAMKEIPYESNSYYIFDRAYNHFKMLYKMHQLGSFFIIRAKKNLQYNTIKWKRRLPKGVLPDQIIELTDFYPRDLFLNTKFQYDKDRFRLNEPNLFNY